MKVAFRCLFPVFAALALVALLGIPSYAETKEEHEKKMTSMNDAHREMFTAGNFEKLDADMNRLQAEYEKGRWTDIELNYFFNGTFSSVDPAQEDSYNKWVAAYPKSYAARFARAYYHQRLTKLYVANQKASEAKRAAGLTLQDYTASLSLTAKPILTYSQLIGVYGITHDIGKIKVVYDGAAKLDPHNVMARTLYMLELGNFGTVADMQALADDLHKIGRSDDDIAIALNIFYVRLFREGRYHDLDREMNAIQKNYEAGKISDANLEAHFGIFYAADPKGEAKYDAWVKAYPNSYAALQSRCAYNLEAALVSRGSKFIQDTSDSELKGMDLYLNRASADCKAAEALTKKPILAYKDLLHIAELNGDWQTRKQMLDLANIADPKNTTVRTQYMYGLQPQWGGSLREMHDFLEQAKEAGVSGPGIQQLNEFYMESTSCDDCNGTKDFAKIGTIITGF
jgi:hypothetical protein